MKNQKHIVKLSSRQRVQLQDITKRGKNNARIITRARILLASEKELSAVMIASHVGVSDRTVERVRKRFDELGFERALHDAPRTGAPIKLTDDNEAHLVATACSLPPDGTSHWTLELLQKKLKKDRKLNISDELIRIRLRERGIKPWREKNVVHTDDNT